MTPPDRRYDVLDKDLRRITVAESAQFHAVRPVLRLGAAILLGVALIFLALGVTGQQPGLIATGVGFVVAGWLGLSIGANDIANSLGPAVGAGAIAIGPGLVLIGLAEIAGAALAGHAVTHRLAEGIVDAAVLESGARGQVMMLAALIGAAAWITIATGASLPVSTSHSIVGAIAGAGLVAAGASALSWGGILAMALAWVMTPFAAAVLAGALLALLRIRVAEAQDRARAAKAWLPPLIGTMVGLFVAYVATLLPALSLRLPLALLPGAGAGLAVALLMRRRLMQTLSEGGEKPGMKRILGQPLLFAAVMMGFAHGAGDAGNVAGPLLVILTPSQTGALQVPLLMLVIAGATIALGALLFGRRLVGMVSEGITRLNAVRAFCITLATAMIVLFASGLGLPVSSTHVAVGGVFGVGFVREMLDRRSNTKRAAPLPAEERRRRMLIRRSHVATITVAWVVTVPITAALGALCCLGMLWVTGV
ncbi:anion permease [Paracoccus sp. WLY502]|uniref:inorganic phosphate transporter n=1 Tax=Paracoccus yibinensis TaxID=3068891 RepID=UPI002796A239|nr:inorganic phosphate transporter [Paracoccus sp. WLY502]MDQ1901449.1 anion permease [Paracoccus sp. WLY502]